ncbi:MAG: zf-HC2 domain-containing protein [Spirochaetaceae bacterium]|jgi:anti-sigma factor RsiW|nr:zf-HC2 domain-containing protein [Spirochaetaceae bacterium]
MCPDKQMLSVYFDNELPSPWKEKLEAHIASCEDCRHALETYTGMSAALALPESGEIPVEEAKARVWEAISRRKFAENSGEYANTADAATIKRRFTQSRAVVEMPVRFMAGGSLWRRGVHIPLPVAIAAAALIALMLFFKTPGKDGRGQPVAVMPRPAAESAVQTVMPASFESGLSATEIEQLDNFGFEFPAEGQEQPPDMRAVLRLLEQDDSPNVVIIKLPEKKQYSGVGGPVILRAIDYAKETKAAEKR